MFKKYTKREINHLLGEENMAFNFKMENFLEKGHAQTEKNIHQAFTVLSDPIMSKIFNLFQ